MSDARTIGKQSLLEVLSPILEALRGVDPGETGLTIQLAERFPLDGPELQAVRAQVDEGLDAGWLTPREAGGVRFGRVAKSATPGSLGFSIDAVDMDGPGPGHTHPNGEIDLCFALEGDPRFDGNPPGWTAYGAGSWHVPTVTGARMAILYFLPEGAIRFEAKPTG